MGRVDVGVGGESQMGSERRNNEMEGEECTHPLQPSASFDLQEIVIEIT